MIYFAYKTDSLLAAIKKAGLKKNIFGETLASLDTLSPFKVYFEELLLEPRDMKNSTMLSMMDKRFKECYDSDEKIYFILVYDKGDSLGRWQGFEFMFAIKYKAEVYRTTNEKIVSLLKEIKDKKIIDNLLNLNNYEFYSSLLYNKH